ncbi:maltooligosyl trehalose synthase [Frankia casuarinae]|uniref:Maltooligosyl trehalose synthase n=1 Tax=Frankia casuarinae (strain DSM 45818 / CECT 9043 / HFP020203 / CcI3) TaxID=106370 RepID=Q2JDB6_FRACC|nr:maltooligosyl trehalose synthase [Frankia casuarinae]ETA02072.1 maltooligosyl trehalose synthase [Frankia sp. CcI6]EYT93279.1 maltooligosyl trehalose synthase [Frankia casuarinae]KDA43954.1 maltooligosyl trehalose synthase [Frankia sp. BMG5.23]
MSADPTHPDGGYGADRVVPTATYRLQLNLDFSLTDAAVVVPYLATLGVSHLYLSPVLEAAPGSTHGYDVVEHGQINPELGGAGGLRRLVAACRKAGLGLIVDVVPNHMAIAPETTNAAWWSVLREGPESPYASWFDIDWASPDNPGRVLVPILGAGLADCLAAGEISVEQDEDGDWVVVYYDHVLPVAAGTANPDDVAATLDAQFYRLCWWRVAATELNYRRFFDITTLAALRQEDPDVFAATHRILIEQVRAGTFDGLRIDHPDGLADPEDYLRRLSEATGGVWTVVEKILEDDEALPDTWACDGTTGYEGIGRLTRLFLDPMAGHPLAVLYGEITRADPDYEAEARAAKLDVLAGVLQPEVDRLTSLALGEAREARADLTRTGLHEAMCEILAAFDVYRAYIRPDGTPSLEARGHVVRACEQARSHLPGRATEVDLIEDLALGGPAEFVVRFQQTCGPVMAKGIEDTAFYRYARLLALNEVGGNPGRFPAFTTGHPRSAVTEFHEANLSVQRNWPLTMTTLSTHDTKRSEDVRARLAVLSEDPRGWAEVAGRLARLGERHRDTEQGWPDRVTVYFLLQTLVGAWPLPADRATQYMLKAVREAKTHTSWTDQDPGYEAALTNYIESVLEDDEFVGILERYVATLVELGRQNSLAQKLLQLTMPGVADVYQGQELWDLSLVDPDNRRAVNYGDRTKLLAEIGVESTAETGAPRRPPTLDDSGAAKLLVVARALRTRRDHPEWFGADAIYRPLWASGSAAENVVAFSRSESVVTVVPRLVLGLRRGGGWRDTTIPLPEGRWTDVLTGRKHDGGTAYVLRLLRDFPVSLLVRA